jgi:uncharacterized protein YxeA
MRFKRLGYLILITLILSILSSCGKTESVNSDEVRKYSDSMLENILVSADKEDYESYSKDFSDKMKEAVNEKNFKEQNKLIKSKIGNYKTKEFLKVQAKGEYITAIYKAKYSEEPKDVMITITFKNNDESHKVEGLFMTSPKLAGK